MPFDSRGHSVAAGSSLTPSSDLYQVDERAAVQSKKKTKDGCLLTSSLLSVWHIC